MSDTPDERRLQALIRRCAWCGVFMGGGGRITSGPPQQSDALVSHGLCPTCEERLMADIGIPIQQFLDAFDTPVTLVGPDTPAVLIDVERGGRLTSANRGAVRVTGTDPHPEDRPLLGEVFECANASLPEGCGRTVHCSACAIRSSIEETWASGRTLDRVPATLKPAQGDDRGEVELEISTRRVGGRVLLTIHRIGPATQAGND